MTPLINIEYLKSVEETLPDLLVKPDEWNSLFVDYETPFVKRLWHQLTPNIRILLHEIHPCENPYWHNHSWASAMKILNGEYEMGVGFSFNGEIPSEKEALKIVFTNGGYYEMLSPKQWHYVKPISEPTYTIMLTEMVDGWSNDYIEPLVKPTNLKPLSEEDKNFILNKIISLNFKK